MLAFPTPSSGQRRRAIACLHSSYGILRSFPRRVLLTVERRSCLHQRFEASVTVVSATSLFPTSTTKLCLVTLLSLSSPMPTMTVDLINLDDDTATATTTSPASDNSNNKMAANNLKPSTAHRDSFSGLDSLMKAKTSYAPMAPSTPRAPPLLSVPNGELFPLLMLTR